jgi:hypothetical protein
MNIKSIQGDDNIQKLCNAAMKETLIALKNEGHMTADKVEEFLDNHIAVFMSHDGGWFDWLKRTFGKETQNALVVCKTYTHID